MKTALVTGAGGFIGSHLCEALVAQGWRLRAMLRYTSHGSTGNLSGLPLLQHPNVEIFSGDLKDPGACREAVRSVSHIFHLGALISIPYSYQRPVDVVQTNITGSANLLEAARSSPDIQRFVQLSSSEVYGTARYTPIDEAHPLHPQSPYAASKVAGDALALSYYLSYGLPLTIVRPFNTYGPRQSVRAVIPAIIGQLLAGKELKLGELSPRRDFLFVTDTVRGLITAATHDATLGQTLNLGTGTAVSIGELLDKIAAIMGVEPQLIQESERLRPAHSEVRELLADAGYMYKLTGWRASLSLEEGLERVIEWMRRHPPATRGYRI